MIDLHVHVLPEVDDGPETLEQALGMCRLASEDGTRVLVATPHQRHPWWPNDDRDLLEARAAELRAACDGLLELRLGAEIAVDAGLLEEVDALPGGPLLTLGGGRWLLLELPVSPMGPASARAMIHELGVGGWRPLLAHVERIPWLAREHGEIAGLVELGARVQVTAMSLTGEWGGPAERRAAELVDRGLVHVVASDGHDAERRPPRLAAAARLVERRWGQEAARALFDANPRAVLDDREIIL